MANIYKADKQALWELLEKSKSETGSTVLIPDLQRPYVWTPQQVTLLVDSLIRGWPFGTLLMWKVAAGSAIQIPFRSFWKVVDRTEEEEGSSVTAMDQPSDYHMVLDGQQRIQSLLLALAGDGWGFKLEDKEWMFALHGKRKSGRPGKVTHWSKGTLCMDLVGFIASVEANGAVSKVDFEGVLKWVVTDPTSGRSATERKAGVYEDPIEEAFTTVNAGRFVRFSRLWQIADHTLQTKERQYRERLEPLLKEHGVSADRIKKLLEPLAEFMTTLHDVKAAEVTYLELVPFNSDIWSQEAYNDAVVNIFTRLNTAGRTLSKEEITFAWLKVGWVDGNTGGVGASRCFLDLQRDLKKAGQDFTLDELVGAASYVWAVTKRKGELLSNSDLLRGDALRPMASDLSSVWSTFVEAATTVADWISDRGLEQDTHYQSVNALALLWAWQFEALIWKQEAALRVPQKHEFDTKLKELFDKYVDRWLILTQWAGIWAASSGAKVTAQAKALASEWESTKKTKTVPAMIKAHTRVIDAQIEVLLGDAADHIKNLEASRRGEVGQYYLPLWLWHRLNAERWEASEISLRTNARLKLGLDVDHIVAHGLWEEWEKDTTLHSALPVDFDWNVVNRMGNCFLLETTFNISKSKKSLRSFLEQVVDFKDDAAKLDEWLTNVAVDGAMAAPASSGIAGLVDLVNARTENMKAELVDYIYMRKERVDLT